MSRIYTDLCTVDVTPHGFAVCDLASGVAFDDIQARTGAKLVRA